MYSNKTEKNTFKCFNLYLFTARNNIRTPLESYLANIS